MEERTRPSEKVIFKGTHKATIGALYANISYQGKKGKNVYKCFITNDSEPASDYSE